MANLKDTIIAGVLRVTGTIYGNLIGKVDGKTVASKIEYILGTQSTSAATGTWLGVSTDNELYDGKEIIYTLPVAGSGNATLNLTLSDGTTTGAKNVYFQGTSRFTTHFGVNTPFRLTYHKSITINGTAYEGWWHHADYNTNTNNAVTQTATTTSANYEVLFSVTADNTTRTEGARKNNNLLFNPSTGNLQATQLNGVAIGSSPKFTDTTYSAGTGLSLSSTTFNHSNSVTAGTAGTSSATSGSTLAVPYVTYDAQGHVTASGTHTHTVSGFLTSHQTIKQDGVTGATVVRFGVCDTAADTVAKTVSITTGTPTLAAGLSVFVFFRYSNTATNPTLNVNGTGAKAIKRFGSIAAGNTTDTSWLAESVVHLIYDGTYWYIAEGNNNVYKANTVKLVTTTVPNVTAVGSVPSLSYTARSVGSASGWSAGSASSYSVSGGTLTLTPSTVPSLTITSTACDDITAWSAGSVPTLGTAITVATGSTSASGSGATVATGIATN